jgi:hypothetical protein
MELKFNSQTAILFGSFRKKAHIGSFPEPRYEIYKTDLKGLSKYEKLSLVHKFLKEIGASDFCSSDLGAIELFNQNNIGHRTLKIIVMRIDKKTEIKYVYSESKPPKE